MRVFALDLIEDLREKRMWPIAALLAVALVAVPLLVLKPAASEPAATDSGAAGTPAAKPPRGVLVEAVDSNDDSSDLKVYKAKDPFRRRVRVKPGAGTATLVTPDPPKLDAPADKGGSGSTGGGGAAGGGGSGGGSTPPAAPTTPPPSPAVKRARYTYVVDVTFGRNDRLRRHRGLQRLSMLPSQDTPLLISLGVDAEADNAVFLVDATLKAAGEGRCPPKGPECAVLSLGAGSEEYFTQPDGDTFLLRVDAIRKVKLETGAKASRARARRAKRSGPALDGRRFVPPIFADLIVLATPRKGGSRSASERR